MNLYCSHPLPFPSHPPPPPFPQSLPKLAVLDISWNELLHQRSDIAVLQRHTPLLKTLNAEYNPWMRVGARHDSLVCLMNNYFTACATLACHQQCICVYTVVHVSFVCLQLEHFRKCTLGSLRTLQSLNGKTVTDKEMTDAIHHIVSTHLSLTSILPHARTDAEAIPTLKLLPLSQHIVKHSR